MYVNEQANHPHQINSMHVDATILHQKRANEVF